MCPLGVLGGGLSTFCGIDTINEKLSGTGDGDRLLDRLHAPVYPFPLYDPYFSAVNWEESEARAPVVERPLLGDRPRVRFRRDVIEHGFALKPGEQVEEARCAFEMFLDVLSAVRTTSFLLETDCAVIWDNHSTLHGRTAFSDLQRHLLRIRLATNPVSDHVAYFNAVNNS